MKYKPRFLTPVQQDVARSRFTPASVRRWNGQSQAIKTLFSRLCRNSPDVAEPFMCSEAQVRESYLRRFDMCADLKLSLRGS
jgi:hypothetical protein